MDKDTLLDLIASRLDVDEILDILGWELPELVEALSDEIMEYKAEFQQAVQ